MTTNHHTLILNFFSGGDRFQADGFRFKPNALAKETAMPITPLLPRWWLLGLPDTLSRMLMMVEIPGVQTNSVFRACSA